jgi:hypothetical protein
MSDLGWRADGIARARAAGAVVLEVYRRPGFTGGIAVRRASEGAGGAGVSIERDPEPYWDDEDKR